MLNPSTESLPSLRPATGVLGAALLSLLLSACVSIRDPSASAWPEHIPPRKFFVEAYQAEVELQAVQPLEDYLQWVISFYEGSTFYPRGWSDLTEEQLQLIEDEQLARRRKTQLHLLGRDIAAEWAKDNDLRRVDTRHLAIWGEAAGRAIKENNVDQTLERIRQDLDQLLASSLPADAITAERYHAPDPDDWFAF
jgi:hypothetical protein